MTQQHKTGNVAQSRAGYLKMMRTPSCKQFISNEWGAGNEIISIHLEI